MSILRVLKQIFTRILLSSSTMSPLLGVYTSVDPSTYSPIHPNNPLPKVQEIASLITELFDLLIDMRYLSASSVSFPPHKHLPLDLTQPARYGVSKDVVDLWQSIPYLNHHSDTNWNFGSDAGEFLQGGEFLDDLRGSWNMKDTWFRTIVDPFYGVDDLNPDLDPEFRAEDADERGWDHKIGPHMRPWYATLSNVGNHGSVMVLNTKTWEMWLIDQLGGSTDPVFQETPGGHTLEDHQCTNSFDLRQYPSRPAVEFLKDMIGRFRSLEWIPGGLYGPEPEEWPDHRYESYKLLYEECGWPDRFNPLLFDKSLAEGGSKYDYGEQSQPEGKTEIQKAYEPLNRLYDVMAGERSLIESQIHIVDAKYRLAHEAEQLPDRERRALECRAEGWQEEIEPPAQRWSDDQARLRIELDFRMSDLEALRTRTGRYSGPGWAGVSDEELMDLYQDSKSSEEKRVSELESLIKDENQQTRLQRQYMEAKFAASAVPKDAWLSLEEKNKEWENDAWEARWSILGSGTSLVDVKRVLDEDMDLERLRKEIVYALEKREDTSWAGQRKWKNKGGIVAMPEIDDTDRGHTDEL
ncbi:hypothetical protein VP1G_03771 [Cytospora mali]|uniref:Uncharacterized protein n=1 Tax=Cytospora mali TaxID=578113 RepID=A0A194UY03_CYTMA|nr:hypothetical protein VP1G_03771 [Valsa mali var. pyri (nom. inval.)]